MRKLFFNTSYLLTICILLSIGNSSASITWPLGEDYDGISGFISKYCHCGQIVIGKEVINRPIVPHCMVAHSHRGWMNSFERKYARAVEDYSKSLELSAQYDGADKRLDYLSRARANAALGRYNEALEDCDSELARSANHDDRRYILAIRGWICLLNRQPEQAVRHLGESIDSSTRQSASSLVLRAIAYEQLGKKNLAEQDFEKALLELSSKTYPLMSRSLSLAIHNAQVYLLARRPRQAIDACSKLISSEEPVVKLCLDRYYAIRADAYRTMGDFRSAAKDYASALDINPEFALLHSKLAYAYQRMGKTNLSKHHAHEAEKLGYRGVTEPPTFVLLSLL